jgi:hypothetical protein
MPRNVAALGGHEADQVQIAVSLVLLDIPGAQKRIHDLDVPLYLNPATNAVSMYAGAGLLKFVPYAGLSVPEIENTDDLPLGDVTFTVANITDPAGGVGSDGEWTAILSANHYRQAPATVWQGNITLPPGTSPFLASFVGVVKVFDGDVEYLSVNRKDATITLGPPIDPYSLRFPRRRYTRPAFPWMRRPGDTYFFGYNEVEI